MRLVHIIEHVSTFATFENAAQAVAGLRRLDDCLGARVIGGHGRKPWQSQAFFADADVDSALPDGCFHRLCDAGLISRCRNFHARRDAFEIA